MTSIKKKSWKNTAKSNKVKFGKKEEEEKEVEEEEEKEVEKEEEEKELFHFLAFLPLMSTLDS